MAKFCVSPAQTQSLASGAQVIDGSVGIGSFGKLQKTPSASGNRTAWTLSGWIKRDKFGSTQYLYSSYASSKYFEVIFNATDQLTLYNYASSGAAAIITTQVFRDSGWYHIHFKVDSGETAAADKLKLYVNGSEVTTFSTDNRASFSDTYWDTASYLHTIGGRSDADNSHFEGRFSNQYFIDGQALEPSEFGYTDPLTNTWRPKKFTGSYTTTSINDGTVFTSTNATESGTGLVAWSSAFNGNFDNFAQGGQGSGFFNIVWDPGWTINTSLRVFLENGYPGWADEGFICNDNTYSTSDLETYFGTISNQTGGWMTIAESVHGGALEKLSCATSSNSDHQTRIVAVEIDGTVMINGADYRGINSFYLPLDGNALIGKDQSGKGNDWTPLNFGGSNIIPKATGALPILNTVNGGNVATVGVRTDTSGNNCVLALPLVSSVTDVSNQINSGSTTKTVTSYSPTASTAESNFYGGSYYFDGSSDYLVVTDSTDLEFGTGDYTIEFWVRPASVAYYWMFSKRNDYADTAPYTMMSTPSGNFEYASSQNGSSYNIVQASFGSYKANKWTHVAVVKDGGVITGYCNGVGTELATGVTLGPFDNSEGLHIGDMPSGGSYDLSGYMQDFRIYKGAAKYTEDFIPASTNPDIFPDTPSGVALGSQLTKVTDYGACTFDGIADYLQVKTSSDFAFGTGAYTLEFWVKSERASGENGLFGTMTASDYGIGIWHNGAGLYFEERKDSYDGANPRIHYTTFDWAKWNHVAMSRDSTSGTLRAFVNGVEVGNVTSNLRDIAATSETVIGENAAAGNKALAHISNLRILKGTALYTANFTPPTAPLTNITNTKLLCCQSPISAGAAAVSPAISGVNNGTVWSDYISGTTYGAGYGAEILFDGSSNYAQSAYPGSITWTPPGGMAFSSTLELEVYRDGVNGLTIVHAGGTTNVSGQITNSQWFKWTVTGITSPITSITWASTNNSNYIAARAIYIDGVELRDPVSVDGNTLPTAFNPFAGDINTVMGKETGYCTFNPLDSYGPLSQGNLYITGGSEHNGKSSIGFNTGKWYAEVKFAEGLTAKYPGLGFNYTAGPYTTWAMNSATGQVCVNEAGPGPDGLSKIRFRRAGVTVDYDGGGNDYFTDTRTFQLALDMDSGKGWIGDGTAWYNDTWNNSGSAANPADGTGNTFICDTSKTWFFWVYANGTGMDAQINFGQKPFKHIPPEGFQPANYANLPSPAVVRPDQYVGVTTYTGTGAANAINVGFSPDFVWIKRRNGANSHLLFDSVRGKDEVIYVNTTDPEDPFSDFDGFNSTNGFTISGTGNGYNADDQTYVSWNLRAGGNKNTFNVDDVGYATAAEVNMSAGSLNNYNQAATWSDNLVSSTGSYAGGQGPTQAFNGVADGSTDMCQQNAAGGNLTWTFSGLSGSVRVWIGNAGAIVTDGNGIQRGDSTGNGEAWLSLSGDISDYNGSIIITPLSDSPSLGAVEVAGKMLVDDDQTPPNLPSANVSKCSVGTKNGFSIIELTTPASGTTYSFAHGLGAKPSFVIANQYEVTSHRYCWHQSFVNNNSYILFNYSNAVNDGGTAWASTAMTSTLIYDQASGLWGNSQKMIYYAWTDIPGLQKFGSYEGNNDADGPYIELGFRPAIVIFKNMDASENWMIVDDNRSQYNPVQPTLYPDEPDTEVSATNRCDFLSNGFKIRSGTSIPNVANTYIYAAWAEAPMNNLFGGQSNAR